MVAAACCCLERGMDRLDATAWSWSLSLAPPLGPFGKKEAALRHLQSIWSPEAPQGVYQGQG